MIDEFSINESIGIRWLWNEFKIRPLSSDIHLL